LRVKHGQFGPVFTGSHGGILEREEGEFTEVHRAKNVFGFKKSG